LNKQILFLSPNYTIATRTTFRDPPLNRFLLRSSHMFMHLGYAQLHDCHPNDFSGSAAESFFITILAYVHASWIMTERLLSQIQYKRQRWDLWEEFTRWRFGITCAPTRTHTFW